MITKRSILLMALLIGASQTAHAGLIKKTIALGLLVAFGRALWVSANYLEDKEKAKNGDFEAAARLFMHEMPDFEANIKIGTFEAGVKKSWLHKFDKCVIDRIKELEEIAKKA